MKILAHERQVGVPGAEAFRGGFGGIPPLTLASPASLFGLGVLYFLTSLVGHFLTLDGFETPVFWPQLGLVFAVLVAIPKAHWWRLIVIFLVAAIAAGQIMGYGVTTCLVLCVSEIAAGAAGVLAYRRFDGRADPIADLRTFHVFALTSVGIAAIASIILQLAFAVLSDSLGGLSTGLVLRTISLFLSLLVTAPFFANLLVTRISQAQSSLSLEVILLTVIVLGLIATNYLSADFSTRVQLLGKLLMIPVLIWAAVRCDSLWSSLMLFLATLAEVHSTLLGIGPMSMLGITPGERTEWVEGLLSVRALAFLTLAAYASQTKALVLHGRLQSERLNSVIDTATDGIITIDEKGIVQTFSKSAERHFGYSASEVIGHNIKMLMPEYYRERHDGYIEKYLETGHRRIIGIGRIVTGLRKDGATFPMELSVGETKVDSRRIFTGFVRDISERQETEQRLHEIQDELFHVSRVSAMGELASALAHELNQPLTAIKNYAQAGKLLLQKDANTKELPRMLDKVNEQAGRAGEIIKKLRAFVSTKHVDVEPEDIHQIIGEASALALIGAKEEGIRTTIVRGQSIPPISVDRIQIQQVLINLIRNAVDAMRDAPRRELIIEAKREDGNVLVKVCDTGPGLDPHVAENLFKPFTTTKQGGMGVGLSISRTIAEAHGGRITYQPNPGGGAIFTLALPISAEVRIAQQ